MSGKAPHNQQAIEDGASILAGMFGLVDALERGDWDAEQGRALMAAQQIAAFRAHGHARETDAEYDAVGALDAVQGAYGEHTTAFHMGTFLAQIARSEAAWDDAFGVLHGKA